MSRLKANLELMISGSQNLNVRREDHEKYINDWVDQKKATLDQKSFAYLLATLVGEEQTALREIREARMRISHLLTDTKLYEFYQRRFDREVEAGYIVLKGTNQDDQ